MLSFDKVHYTTSEYFLHCVSQAGFFKRDFQKKTEEEFKRDSWDYVPKNDARESTS